MGKENKKIKTIVVVVNWNGLSLLKGLFDSLRKQTDKDFALVVLDNGSRDGSKDFLFKEAGKTKSPFPTWILNAEENYGFALANNIAISFAFDYLEFENILLLNNDTRPSKNFVEVMHAKAGQYFVSKSPIKNRKKFFPLLSDSEEWLVGSLAPLIENYFERGTVDSAGILFSDDGNAINKGVGEKIADFKQEEEVFGPTGAAVMFRVKALKDVVLPPRKMAFIQRINEFVPRLWQISVDRETEKEGSLPLPIKEFFASRYFAYFEDVDLDLRLRLRFWSCILVPQAKISHHHSATGKSYSPFKSFHIHRNQYFNLIRDFPLKRLAGGFKQAFGRYFLLLKSVRDGRGPAAELTSRNGKLNTAWLVIKGWGSVLANLFGLITERLHIQSNRLLSDEEFDDLLFRFKASKEKMIFETPDSLRERRKSDAEDRDRDRLKLPGA